MKNKFAVLLLALTTGCATARLAGQVPITAPDPGVARIVVLEPFFETAEWQTTVKMEVASVMNPATATLSPLSSPFATEVTVARTVEEKPVFARVAMLAEEHRQVLAEVQRLRPSWRVTSTGGAQVLEGPVTLVRAIVHAAEVIESDRQMKNLAFGFGLVILPLLALAIPPVNETQRVYGALHRHQLGADELRRRLVRYPTQPDFAVNTTSLPLLERRFGLELTYKEGLLANETPREGVLVRGFCLKLASAIVALVEEPGPN